MNAFRRGPAGRSTIMVTVALLVAGVAAAEAWGAPPPPLPATADSPDTAERGALLDAHNRERARAKLAPFKANAELDAAALVHARDMATHNKMTHDGSDGSTPAQRVERQDYHYLSMGENVAMGEQGVAEAMRIWMDSPPHREHILGDFTEMGSASARSKDGTIYWCVEFGRPIPVLDPREAAQAVVDGFNRERRTHKKPPLKVHDTLAAAARRHARDMAKHDALRQRDDDGLDPLERIKKSDYRYRRIAEATASGPPTADEAVRSWLKDDSNRESILGDFTNIGVGYATSKNGTPYWSLILGLPRR